MDSLIDRIRHWANIFGDKQAIDDGRSMLTYSQLFQKVEQVACHLHEAGVGRGDHVAVVLPKQCDAVVAILAALRVGATYVPVDAKAPVERIKAILEDCVPAMVILSRTLRQEALNAEVYPYLELDQLESRHRDAYAYRASEITDPCYVLYTSGSTGKPNGVSIPHQAMLSFFAAVNCFMGIDHTSRCMNTSALYFDVSIVDLFLPLYQGASVFLGPETPMPIRYHGILAKQEITHMCAVGSTLSLIASQPGFDQRNYPHLKCIMTGAEVLNKNTMKAWLQAAPEAKIINGYGPTEVTCVCTAFEITPDNVDSYENYPIGVPLPGVEVALDSLEAGEGELCFSGNQVMAGYINRLELNRDKFLTIAGKRFYRSGDIARYDDDGNLCFLRRKDFQVKVRGYRIHLEDVAQPFRNLEGVTDAFVVPVIHQTHGECLSVAIASAATTDLEDLLQRGAANLPTYMRPKFIGQLHKVPTKPSGKADVSAVHALVKTHFETGSSETTFLLEALAC